ncbi:hypothetical protein L202_01764 [Cryptococcus amylolentus CBS 6039]|uniref:NAD-dependent epimerase/dehydratase domain-containing protein n=1 Tax=Cryptococcus amylolentus CBS 6039 TaxID=1295533 RepID=A0A1E3I592_9TREE|nr:hypothetical protein L202_01764 [Cryptococcus amylolentus CBS 6039]ODN83667.1 hypothetical protein L202_01764 [Cryptococcus amylolentus CBS 6039]
MPTVLLTGMTGFLAAHIAHSFLRHGWTVHGTLRSNSKRAAVEAVPEYAPYLASGPSNLLIGAPQLKVLTRENHLKRAVDGTKGVLQAAAKEADIKSVVLTSSIGDVEDDWNSYTLEQLGEISATQKSDNPVFPPGMLFYMGSKKYAELAAWDAQKEAKAQGSDWSLATINCVLIWGPPIQPLSSLSQGGMSTEFMWMLAGGKDKPIMTSLIPYYVDPPSDTLKGDFSYLLVITISKNTPTNFEISTPPKPTVLHSDPGVYDVSNEKSKRELGMTYRPHDETLKDTFDRFFELEKQGLQ